MFKWRCATAMCLTATASTYCRCITDLPDDTTGFAISCSPLQHLHWSTAQCPGFWQGTLAFIAEAGWSEDTQATVEEGGLAEARDRS
mmetsp:Transcript_27457/g.78896  ORF Transcript_27457/g.78896 Transcript_27457/m.78896 type:complete len:87 (+) Transcript_27457:1501-1761(+)